ncbi:hypothetical protein C0J52_28019, partial [Blattella germanica]
ISILLFISPCRNSFRDAGNNTRTKIESDPQQEHYFEMTLLLLSVVNLALLFSVAFAIKKELVPGLGYYWIPKILNNVSVQYRWDESMSSCYYEGGHLAVINSKEEAEILAKVLESEADTPLEGQTGYDLVPEMGYYKFYDEKVKWGEALERCHHEGSTLAVINSDEEAKVIAALFEGHEDAQLAHVGIQDRYREAFYYTVDGTYYYNVLKIEDTKYVLHLHCIILMGTR